MPKILKMEYIFVFLQVLLKITKNISNGFQKGKYSPRFDTGTSNPKMGKNKCSTKEIVQHIWVDSRSLTSFESVACTSLSILFTFLMICGI